MFAGPQMLAPPTLILGERLRSIVKSYLSFGVTLGDGAQDGFEDTSPLTRARNESEESYMFTLEIRK